MALTIGTQLGSHEITALLGKGGMGEVYRARDTKLKREVAIKILPQEFSNDIARVSRFQREAEVLASLNHPNIGGIHDIQESNGFRYLVLELVEGDTLEQRLQTGPIPLDETLKIAKQICEALEAAHERGIIHRDLKPANIKLTGDGRVKVLDFGLAKAFQAHSEPGLSNSPTLMTDSMPGTIIGTAAYMSPEQARGKAVDRRTDIWAFGCVLYEMLTGSLAFNGDVVTDILARILEREPNFDLLSRAPTSILNICRRCLNKDLRRRFQDIGDVRFEIETAMSGAVEAEPAGAAPRPRSKATALVMALLGLAVLLLAVPAGMFFRGTRTDRPEIRLDITTPATTDPLSLAVSPDGRKVLFAAASDNKMRLWLRSLESSTAQPIAGTDGATYPFWAPDSRNAAFFADGKLKRIDVFGGASQVLADAPAARGGAWNKEDVILFAPAGSDRIYRISAAGGDVTPLTQMEGTRQNNHRLPQFLPDGRHFLFYAMGTSDGAGEYVGSLDGKEQHRLFAADAAAVFIPPDHIAFLRQGTLYAQLFDTGKNVPAGPTSVIAEQVSFDSLLTLGSIAAAPGTLVYRTGTPLNTGLVWFDRKGQRLSALGDADFGGRNPEISPDGKRVVVDGGTTGSGVWSMDASRGAASRLTVDPALNLAAVWSPRSDRIAFASNRTGHGLYAKPAAGGEDQLLLAADPVIWPESWSPDGRYILYRAQNTTGFDLWALSLDDHKSIPVANTDFEEREGQFSPDGHWVAYQSNESGRTEIYIQSFPVPISKTRISTNGGAQVRWKADGKEIFYISLDGKLMAAKVILSADGKSVEVGNESILFPVQIALGPKPVLQRQQYAVSADGQRFLISVTTNDNITNPITMILNWHAKSGS